MPIKGINNEKLKELILEKNPFLSILNAKNIIDVKNLITKKSQPHDLLLIMGAGDIAKLSKELLKDQLST